MERTPIRIFDTTLRDGEQSPGCSMHVGEKVRLAKQLDRLGVDVIEAGFPIASEGDFAGVQAVAAEVRRPVIAALARACEMDVERASLALRGAARGRIHVFLATSEIHLKHKLRITHDQCLERATMAVSLARNHCADVEFSPEDATRSDHGFLFDVLAAVVEAGATTLNIPDTVGYTTPAEYGALIAQVNARFGVNGVTISTHCHNDLGLAVANSLAGVAAGAQQVECTINGIGERAGNASLEEVVMAMRVRADQYAYETGIAGEHLYPTSQLLSEITGVEVQPNKAIIGRNAFAHEAGIHQDGVLKNPLTYEIMTPQSVGVPDSSIVLGKHSGRHALGKRYEQLGMEFDRSQLDEVYKRFVLLADEVKQIDDDHLLQLVRKRGERPSMETVAKPRMQAMAASAGPTSNGRHRRTIETSGVKRPAATFIPAAEHSKQPEDYLWGV